MIELEFTSKHRFLHLSFIHNTKKGPFSKCLCMKNHWDIEICCCFSILISFSPKEGLQIYNPKLRKFVHRDLSQSASQLLAKVNQVSGKQLSLWTSLPLKGRNLGWRRKKIVFPEFRLLQDGWIDGEWRDEGKRCHPKSLSYFEREKFLIGEGEVDLRVVPLPNPT